MSDFTPLDWTICVGYLAIVTALGIRVSRRQRTTEDYFFGGRRMHWLPIGLSLFAGMFSSLSFVGLPREAAYADWHLYLGILFLPLVVTPIVAWVFLPRYRRLDWSSPYEYLEHRFSRLVRLVASAIFVLYALGWMGTMLVALGRILQVLMGLSDADLAWALVGVGLFATFYTTLGGVKAVVWTDALQAFTLGGGMLAVLLLAVSKIDGGWAAVWEIGMQNEKFEMFRMELDFEKPNFFAACAFGFFVYLGHTVSFGSLQRYLSMPTIRAARRSLAVNGVMVAVVCGVFFLVGSTLFVFYHQSADPMFAELQANKRGDQLLPRFILAETPGYGLTGLLLTGLFAAVMSSTDSGINSLTATVVCDWVPGRQLSLKASRILSAAFGIAVVAVALVLRMYEGPIFHVIMQIAGAFLGLLLGVFVLGMISHRANATSALAGMVAGALCVCVAKWHEVGSWWYGACATVPTLIVGLAWALAWPRGRAGAAI